MLDLGEPLVTADTCLIRTDPARVFALLCDPAGFAAFWPELRTFDHKLAGDQLEIGDRWQIRALAGVRGIDCEAVVTDLKRRDTGGNLWMDWTGHIDPFVGFGLQRNVFEAETEWYVRPWTTHALVSFIWRLHAEPRRPQARLMLDLRRLGWRAMSGLKHELEIPRASATGQTQDRR